MVVDSLLSWREEGSLAYRFNTEHQADMSEMKEVFEDALQSVKTVRAHLISLFYRFHSFGILISSGTVILMCQQ